MPIDLQTFRKWIRQIYATRDQEMDCEGFFEAIPKYIDFEIAGGNANLQFPEVQRHLAQCPRCKDLYDAVREAARLESESEAAELIPVRSAKRPPTP
jgi:predicted anti-sigma-YlaC factor YlaD